MRGLGWVTSSTKNSKAYSENNQNVRFSKLHDRRMFGQEKGNGSPAKPIVAKQRRIENPRKDKGEMPAKKYVAFVVTMPNASQLRTPTYQAAVECAVARRGSIEEIYTPDNSFASRDNDREPWKPVWPEWKERN